jgi:hypothetical protein
VEIKKTTAIVAVVLIKSLKNTNYPHNAELLFLTIELFNFATIWFEVMLSAVSTDLGLLEIVDFSAFIFF